MPRCKECDARLASGAGYCSECGEKVKRSRERGQQNIGKRNKEMQGYIDYLTDSLTDAGIKFDSIDDYEE